MNMPSEPVPKAFEYDRPTPYFGRVSRRRRAAAFHGAARILLALHLSLCVSALNGPAAAQSDVPAIDAQVAQGVNLINSGQFQQAVELLNRAKQDAPQDPRPYFYCGTALAQAGNMQEAAAELGEAVHLAPETLEYRVFQAHVFDQLRQTSEAENTLAILEDENKLRHLDPSWLRLLADVYFRLQKADEALRVLDLWAERDPRDSRIDLFRGQVYVLKGRPDTALGFYHSSLAKSHTNPLAYFEIGRIQYERNQLAEAKENLRKAVEEDKDNPEYLSKLASAYVASGDADAAIACLQNIESKGDRIPAIYYSLGRAYHAKGDSARSAEYMHKFQNATATGRERDERKLAAERPIAQALRQLGEGHPAVARELFQKALEIDPTQWLPHANLAEMNLDAGDFSGAYPHLAKLQEIDPDSAVCNFLLARYWFHEKQYARARTYAEKVRSSRPANAELRALLGDIYLQLGQRPKAMEEYAAALRVAPGRQDVLQRLQEIQKDSK